MRWGGQPVSATTSLRRLVVIAAVGALALAATVAPVGANEPRVQQQLVYELNRARWDPYGFAQRTRITLPGGVLPAPPLAVNDALTASAAFRADEMAVEGYIGHRSPVTGRWPNEVARSFGFDLPSVYRDASNSIESLSVGSSILLKTLRSLIDSPAHRAHLLGEGGFAAHTEVGAGRSDAENYWTIQTGVRPGTGVFVTGVVFDDADGDGRMDAGEGLAGVRVHAGDRSVLTNAGGGYSIAAKRGRLRVWVDDRGIASSTRVRVGDYNVMVDFRASDPEPVVRRYDLCAGLPPTILGTEGDDVITGTPGPDVILAGAGHDRIDGRGGDDVICGGPGRDIIRGSDGADLIDGGGGRDRIIGGRGNDVLRGSRGVDELFGSVGRDRLFGEPPALITGRSGALDPLDGGPGGRDTCRFGEQVGGCERS
jgi:hypothetical protein